MNNVRERVNVQVEQSRGDEAEFAAVRRLELLAD